MKVSMAGPDESYRPGGEYDVPGPFARAWIDRDLAVSAEPAAPETATAPPAPEKAVKPKPARRKRAKK